MNKISRGFIVFFVIYFFFSFSPLTADIFVLEDFDDISDVSAGQGGTISSNTIPLYINSGSSCRVADTDTKNVAVQCSGFDKSYNLKEYSTFRVSVYFSNINRIERSWNDSIIFTLFSQKGEKWNSWYLPIPVSNGWVTYERELSDFDSDDGGGVIDLTNVNAWRFVVNRISGSGDFVYYIDDLIILPPQVSETSEYWKYRTSDLVARINKTNGLLEQLTTISGIPKTILPLTSRGLDITVKNVTKNWSGGIIGLGSNTASSGMIGGKVYKRIECQYTLDSANGLNNLISLTSQYTFFNDRMDIKFNANYLQNSSDHYEIVMGQHYVPSDWQTEIYPGGSWHIEYDTTSPIPTTAGEVILEYADAINSYYDFRTWAACIPYVIGGHGPMVALPYGVLQNNDTFFLWGYRDLGRFVILSPRRYNKIPSFLISPLNLTAGDSYSFDFSYRSFSKPRNTYTDVVKWYAENMYSTHPASAGLVTKPHNLPHRTIDYGNLATPALYIYGRLSAHWSDLEDKGDSIGMNLKMTNVWGAYWIDDEIYKTTGILHPSYGHDTTPEELRAYFDYLRGIGFKSHLYFRQMLSTTYKDKPPYTSWIMLSEDGKAYQYATGPVPLSTGNSLMADFANPDFRNWYIQAVKDSVTYYGVDAVAWDMGWMDSYTGYAACNPPLEGNGIHHGILAVQSEIYTWLKANYPEKKVTTNGASHGYSPSGLYADGVMFEGGTVRSRDVEAIKAYNLDIINLTYADFFQSFSQDYHIQTIMRAFSQGATWASTTLELFEHPDPTDPCHTRGLGLYLNDLEVLADYSALANSLPLMTESYAVMSSNPKIYANAWADSNNLLIAVYNDTGGSASFSIDLNKEILSKYGQDGSLNMRAIHFNSQGLPDTANVSLTKSDTADNCIRFQGNFGVNELVVIVKDTSENQRSPDHIYLSCDESNMKPGNSTVIKIEVVDKFDRRFASPENVTITIDGSGRMIKGTKGSGNEIIITSIDASSWSPEHLPVNAMPGRSGCWYSKGNSMPEWIAINLQEPQEINAVYFNFGVGAKRQAVDYEIQIWDESAQKWLSSKNVKDNSKEEIIEIIDSVKTNKIRLYVSKTYQPDYIQRVDEIRVFNLPSEQIKLFKDENLFKQSMSELLNKFPTVHSELIGASGDDKTITGKTNDQGFATIQIISDTEETMTLKADSKTLLATQPHKGISINFKYPTSILIDGFSNYSGDSYLIEKAIAHFTQTSLDVKEGKVSLKLMIDSSKGNQGLFKTNKAIPLDLSDYAKGGYISWWLNIENPSGLTGYRFSVFDKNRSNFEQIDIKESFTRGWKYYEFPLPLPINGGTPLNWSNFAHYEFEFYGISGDPYMILIDDLRVYKASSEGVIHK